MYTFQALNAFYALSSFSQIKADIKKKFSNLKAEKWMFNKKKITPQLDRVRKKVPSFSGEPMVEVGRKPQLIGSD
jgi:hypothetical protein